MRQAISVTGREHPKSTETSRIPHVLDNRVTDGAKSKYYTEYIVKTLGTVFFGKILHLLQRDEKLFVHFSELKRKGLEISTFFDKSKHLIKRGEEFFVKMFAACSSREFTWRSLA
jgi:hypothetical protein